jgi:hypothetical protein
MNRRSIESRLKTIENLLKRLVTQEQTIMETQNQEALDIQAVADQVTGIGVGIVALEAALAAAGGTTPAVDTALANLKAAAATTAGLLPASTGATTS